jgi:isopentenyl diphosphate isomerase/L-lactate dehydrogenase-like FMN-dependent dehydrogenase
MSVSSFAGTSITDVGKVTQNLHFQLYWLGTRSDICARLDRAAAAGAKGLIVTLDLSRTTPRRDWSRRPAIPSEWTWGTVIRHSATGIRHPGWLLSYLRRFRLPGLRVPNLAGKDGYVPTFAEGLDMMRVAARPTRQDLEWLRERWDGPLMIKGVNTVRDALIAESLGADAIGLSNHGGNHLDGTVAPIRSLPAVFEALEGRVPISIDGGVRRGTDVIKGVALGATVALLGRAVAYGLAVGGEEGVHRTLEIIRSGVVEGLDAMGAHDLADIRRSDAVVREASFSVTPSR